MKILVVAATHHELTELFNHFELPERNFLHTSGFDVLITGVGMTATAYALGKRLSNDYDLVLNLGIAGSFDKSIPLGTLLNITSDEFAELGAEDSHAFLTLDQLGFGESKYTVDPIFKHSEIDTLRQVHGITVNKVHGHEKSITDIVERLHPVTESMEGAAVFYACRQESVPCLQIRSISNYIEKRNKEAWKIGLAIKELNKWAINFLTNT